MNRRELFASVLGWIVAARHAESILFAQRKPIEPDLASLADSGKLVVFNRQASKFVDGGRQGVRMSEAPNDGVAYVPGLEFSNGTIEMDIRGKDVQQQSFVGVAFHGNGKDAYILAVGGKDEADVPSIWVSVINADGTWDTMDQASTSGL